MTDLSGGRPDSAFTSSEVKTLQSTTESEIRERLYGQQRNVWGNAKGNFYTEALGGVFKGITDFISGAQSSLPDWLPGPAKDFAFSVRDGQESLNDRTDLLSPLLDYCSAYAPPNNNNHARFGPGRMPFTSIIGPSRNVEVTPSGGMKLLDKGIWDIRAQVTVSWTSIIADGDVRVGIRVLRPDGSIFSQQTMIEKTTNITSFTIVSSVAVRDPGYVVEVWVERMDSGRGVFGGPQWSRLTVQHITRQLDNHDGSESSTPAPDQPSN